MDNIAFSKDHAINVKAQKSKLPKQKLYIQNNESGNILVTSLLILLVMNLLGIGIANLSTKEWTTATHKTIDAEVHHMTETCSQDVILWFGTQTSTPTAIETTTGSPSSAPSTSPGSTTESTDITKKLTGFTYSCDTTYITSKQATSSRASGAEVGNSGGSYGGAGNMVVKDYYQINSTGSGPKNSSKTINSIISVEY